MLRGWRLRRGLLMERWYVIDFAPIGMFTASRRRAIEKHKLKSRPAGIVCFAAGREYGGIESAITFAFSIGDIGMSRPASARPPALWHVGIAEPDDRHVTRGMAKRVVIRNAHATHQAYHHEARYASIAINLFCQSLATNMLLAACVI